jgi:hypothetical protein
LIHWINGTPEIQPASIMTTPTAIHNQKRAEQNGWAQPLESPNQDPPLPLHIGCTAHRVLVLFREAIKEKSSRPLCSEEQDETLPVERKMAHGGALAGEKTRVANPTTTQQKTKPDRRRRRRTTAQTRGTLARGGVEPWRGAAVTPHVSKPHDYVNHMFMRL